MLLSGGLDSTTVLAMARNEGFGCYCLSFQYGQRQSIELERAKDNSVILGAVDHLVLHIGLDAIGGSALTSEIEVPKGRSFDNMETGIPQTYVPGRNTIFLAYAMAWAEVLGADNIFIGINALDYSGYPDCRSEFLQAFEKAIRCGTKRGVEKKAVKILTPLLDLTKRDIVALAERLDVPLSREELYPGLGGRGGGDADTQ